MFIKPTREECRIIRECAQKDAKRSRVEIQPGIRENIKSNWKRGTHMNIAMVSDDPEWDDTDLHDFSDWATFKKGFDAPDDGRAIIDFYVYEMVDSRELMTNVQAIFENGRMVRVDGTPTKGLWRI